MHPNDPRRPLGHIFLMANLLHDGEDCLLWPYSTCTPGYGIFSHKGKKATLAHRFMCELKNGPPPTKAHHAAHSCGNRRCVNPTHLSWKTPAENQLDRRGHGTASKTTCKLNLRQAEQIKKLKGVETSVETAARYGITESNVRLIQDGKTWRTVGRKFDYWTPEEDDRLIALMKGGASYAKAGEILGRNVSGRAHRLGIRSTRDPHAIRGPRKSRQSLLGRI